MKKYHFTEEKKILFGLALVFLLIFGATYAGEVYFCGEKAKNFHFWLQLATGSSWPSWEEYYTNQPLWFSLGVALHTMLNIGPLLGIVWLGLKLLQERKTMMNFAQAVKLRDMDIKVRIKNEVFNGLSPEERTAFSKTLDTIFNDSTENWKEDLSQVVGPEGAQHAVEIMKYEI